eukprot:Rhum_TRINITY_DN23040_c0_g1::Rhum_TRINITY_DN23040_c0_g1_i1::g.176988::m.176988
MVVENSATWSLLSTRGALIQAALCATESAAANSAPPCARGCGATDFQSRMRDADPAHNGEACLQARQQRPRDLPTLPDQSARAWRLCSSGASAAVRPAGSTAAAGSQRGRDTASAQTWRQSACPAAPGGGAPPGTTGARRPAGSPTSPARGGRPQARRTAQPTQTPSPAPAPLPQPPACPAAARQAPSPAASRGRPAEQAPQGRAPAPTPGRRRPCRPLQQPTASSSPAWAAAACSAGGSAAGCAEAGCRRPTGSAAACPGCVPSPRRRPRASRHCGSPASAASGRHRRSGTGPRRARRGRGRPRGCECGGWPCAGGCRRGPVPAPAGAPTARWRACPVRRRTGPPPEPAGPHRQGALAAAVAAAATAAGTAPWRVPETGARPGRA